MFTVGPAFWAGGGDQFFGNVALLLHCDGTHGTRVYVDSSSYARTLTETGTNSLSNVQKKFGPTSAFFNDGAIQVPDSPSMELGSGPWCIEWWQYSSTGMGGILCKYFSSTPAFPVPIAIRGTGGAGSERVQVRISSDGVTYGFDQEFPSSGGGAWALNVWTHIAVVFDGSAITVYSNGVSQGSAACSTAVRNTADELQIGRDKSSGGYMNGYLDDIRVTIGVPRYTAAFTPPSKAFPDS